MKTEEVKHTPGPWKSHRFAKGNVVSESGRLIAACMGYSTNQDNGEHIEESCANAELIIQAPDLKKQNEELRELISSCEETLLFLKQQFAETDDVIIKHEIDSRLKQIERLLNSKSIEPNK